jgi:hypothetical protein
MAPRRSSTRCSGDQRSRPYVYLSDGGHFDNLGLYEMVRRRCRFIVVSDAGCDPAYRFDDLANAIRLVRSTSASTSSSPRACIAGTPGGVPGAGGRGRIRYSSAEAGAEDGVLLYLKAALCGDEPVDVANYAARTRPSAPADHEPVVRRRTVRELSHAGAALGAVADRGSAPRSVAALCAIVAARRTHRADVAALR